MPSMPLPAVRSPPWIAHRRFNSVLHFDAAEWAPSTAPQADIQGCPSDVRLPPEADMGTQSWNVRFVPKADKVQCSNWDRYSITSAYSEPMLPGARQLRR